MRNAGVKFDKSVEGQSALAFFKANGYPDDPACIRPDLASFTDRLREIDDLREDYLNALSPRSFSPTFYITRPSAILLACKRLTTPKRAQKPGI